MQINIDKIAKVIEAELGGNSFLEVIDESYLHKGHAGYNQEIGVTHVKVLITSPLFDGLTLLQRQRMANSWLDVFLKNGLHAVSFVLKSPHEVV